LPSLCGSRGLFGSRDAETMVDLCGFVNQNGL
jgi:hypothetical protein